MFSNSYILKHLRKEKIELGTKTRKDIKNKQQIKKKGKDVLQIQMKEVQRKKSTKIEKIKSITDEFDKTYNSTLSQITTKKLSDLESHRKVPGNVHINHKK
jgi:hypothetical protein